MLINRQLREILLKGSTCYQHTRTLSTLINVKPSIEKGKSYVGVLNEEWEEAKPFEQLPGLTKLQLIRGFMKGGEFYNSSTNDLILKCREKFGDIFLLPGPFGQPNSVAVFNIADFEKVFRTEGEYPERPGMDAMVYYRNRRKDGFFNETLGLIGKGEDWGKFRHAVNPVLMQPRNVKLYMDPMQKVNEDFIQRVRDIRDPITKEVPDDFIQDINRLTFESVAVVALDKQFGLLRSKQLPENATELFRNLQLVMKSIYDLGVRPSLYRYIPTPTYKRFEKAMDSIFDTISAIVNETLQRIESQPHGGPEKSVLEKLLKIDRKIAIIMAMDMLMGSVDTTSSVLSGMLLCIAKNPQKQQKLREELSTYLPNKSDKFTIDNMKHLPYLRACIKESLRIYPLLFGNLRATGRDIALGGYRIPKGTRTLLCSHLLLSDERLFPRAKEFIPERWLRGDESREKLATDNLNPFVYLPFGFGPRSCVGKRIVDLELEMALGNMVRNFNIEFNYPVENAFKTYFISTPNIPLKFKFTDVGGN